MARKYWVVIGYVLEAPSTWRSRAVHDGRFDHYRWLSVAGPIGGGTSEIQRTVIATRGLGLPADTIPTRQSPW